MSRPHPSSIAEGADYVPFIDGLRGIAILMVMLDHVGLACNGGQTSGYSIGTFGQFVVAGGRGVQLFFLLSAFTLMRTAHRRYAAGGFNRADFYIRRAFRILPLWWAVNLILAAAYGILGSPGGVNRLFINAGFIFGFLRFRPGVETVPGGWSLFVEESFYALMPFVYGMGLSLVGSVRLLLATMFIAWLWGAVAAAIGVPSANGFVFYFPLSNWFCFAAGIVLYQLRQDRALASRLNTRSVAITLDLAALLFTFLFLRDANLMVVTMAMVMVFVAASSERSVTHYLTTRVWLMRFGAYCYSIYLLHVPLLAWTAPARLAVFRALGLIAWPPDIQVALWFPVVAAVMFLVGSLSFRFFEKPCVGWGRRVARLVSPVAATA